VIKYEIDSPGMSSTLERIERFAARVELFDCAGSILLLGAGRQPGHAPSAIHIASAAGVVHVFPAALDGFVDEGR